METEFLWGTIQVSFRVSVCDTVMVSARKRVRVMDGSINRFRDEVRIRIRGKVEVGLRFGL